MTTSIIYHVNLSINYRGYSQTAGCVYNNGAFLRIWDISGADLLHTITLPCEGQSTLGEVSVKFSPDGNKLWAIIAELDNAVIDVSSGMLLGVPSFADANVMAFSGDESKIVGRVLEKSQDE